jgi:hypothetical protein
MTKTPHHPNSRKRKRAQDDAAAAPLLRRPRRVTFRQPFRFNDLPQELRDEIYGMALRNEGSHYLHGKALPLIGKMTAEARGVLQGSPLSPCLFNLFVDGLLEESNSGSPPIPRSLFYADDGVLLASSSSEIQRLLDIVVRWSASHRTTLNVGKCGYLAPLNDEAIVRLGREEIPRLDRYAYLGFPITCVGIDFEGHLTGRLDRSLGRAAFLSLHSRVSRLKSTQTYL